MLRRTSVMTFLALLAISVNANAAFLGGGNTNPGDAGVDGTLNFAVYAKGGGGLGDTYGTGLAGFDATFAAGTGSPVLLDTTKAFLYLYQVTNNGPGTAIIEGMTVTLPAGSAALGSWGSFLLTGFSDAAGLTNGTVGAGGNNFGGPDGAATVFADPDVAHIAIAADLGAGPYVAANVGFVPDSVIYTPGTKISAFFLLVPILTGGDSILIGFTSDGPPFLTPGGIIDGSTADGVIAGPIGAGIPLFPEPGTLVMWSVLSGLGLVTAARKRRAAKA